MTGLLFVSHAMLSHQFSRPSLESAFCGVAHGISMLLCRYTAAMVALYCCYNPLRVPQYTDYIAIMQRKPKRLYSIMYLSTSVVWPTPHKAITQAIWQHATFRISRLSLTHSVMEYSVFFVFSSRSIHFHEKCIRSEVISPFNFLQNKPLYDIFDMDCVK